jgi:hypothetical protein
LAIGVAEEHLLRIARMNEAVGRSRDPRRHWIDEIRSDDDHKLSLEALKTVRAEQRSEDWDVA